MWPGTQSRSLKSQPTVASAIDAAMLGLCALLITGTAHARSAFQIRSLSPVSPSLSSTVVPPIDTEAEAELGQSMISTEWKTTNKVIRTQGSISQKVGSGLIRIPATELELKWENRDGQFYGDDTQGTFHVFGVLSAESSVSVFVPTSKSASLEACTTQKYVGTSALCIPISTISYSDATVSHRDLGPRFRREIIYNGVAKGVVRLAYREFKDDLARPAFSQELTYDIAEGDEVGYSGMRIKILKATNTTIKYVVIRTWN